MSGIDGASFALSVGGSVQSPWNGIDSVSVPGDPGAEAVFEFEIIITLPDTKGGTYTIDVNGEEINVEVEGDTVTYGTPIVTLSYATIP
ncbi:MAG: hypothetical protein LUE27_08125, partial [Clostridia bacterium]|nr:hypothetical protein [Clostridia bacterium]